MSNKKARRLDETLQEKDRAMVQVEAEKQAALHAKGQLEEEHATLVKLQGEEKSKAMLMGVSLCCCSPRKEVAKGDMFILEAPLDKECSVLGSEAA
ncbi:uncharacterized protein A4U43_C07F23570 [Asparagus officinalis]|uniref:Uncharacterized protein n=1 Tax=Asparagus officinalis TaxID=4686 RepID=A0A5P1EHC4_ASPOF|nr:uncharacterized protein A4U43_C07F23570 [Asparagus officinalis]